ncbi:glycosyltransferase family 4 protein [Cytobacillus gottheilii]|uniref:glycosyltransferase family 4 protein n=1 Tax=Cytobacillus gottheilii TaxID=859144 RepID=UPI003CEE6710
MKILFIFYVPSGGIDTLNRQRSIALKEKGIQPEFLYYTNKRNYLNDHGAPVYITDNDSDIKAIIDNGNYDASVIVSDFEMLKRLDSLGFKGKKIIEIQGYGPKSRAREFFLRYQNDVRQYCDGLLNPKTPHIVELMDEIFPEIPKFSFNNCFDTENFSYVPGQISSLPIIAWTGRIEDNKNWREFLLIAAQLYRVLGGNLRIHMYEDPSLSTPEERMAFNKLVKQLQLQDALHIFENVRNDEMKLHYSMIGDSGGFYCMTSKVEGAPFSPLEALSCCCPVLTTDSDGVRTSIIHNATGKYYTIGDVSEAVREAKDLMGNLSLRDQIRVNGLEHVKANFNRKLYAENFCNMLHSLGLKIN